MEPQSSNKIKRRNPKMKKNNLFRILALAMALVMLVAVVACTNEGDATATTEGATTAGATTTAKATTKAATTAKATTAVTTAAATTVATTAAPNAPSIYSGTPDVSWFDKENPKTEYTLTTADQFAGFFAIRQTSKGAITFEGITIKLDKDIIINAGTATEYLKSSPKAVTALASGYLFKGTFDGQGHTVSGVYLDCTSSGVKGLFGGLGDNAVIKNLKFTNAHFDGAEKDKRVGGILASRANGTNILLSNITIENATMVESSNEFRGVGLLLGKVDKDASLTIENCSTSGTIDFASKGTWGYGGLIGFALENSKVTIKNSTSSAIIMGLDYCGGLVGAADPTATVTFDNSTFTGSLACTGQNSGTLIGGTKTELDASQS